MLHKLSNNISDKLSSSGIISIDRKRVYAYGLELLLASICGIGVLMILSIVFRKPFIWIPYLLAFIPMRLNAGGFHARSHLGCITSFSSVFATLIITSHFIPYIRILSLVVSITCLILVLVFAPIETKNNPLKAGRKHICRRNSIILSIFNLIVSIVTYFCFKNLNYVLVGYFSGLTAAVIFFSVVIFESIYERRKSQ